MRTILPTLVAAALMAPALALDESMQGDVRFITGGAGEDEAQEIRQLAPSYALRIDTYDRDGKFLADVHVVIRRGRAILLDTTSTGPFLLVQLPPGTYQLDCELDGRKARRSVQVGRSPRRVEVYL